MKRGTPAEQKEQWEIFAKLVEAFSAHIGASKDQLLVETKERRSGPDGEPLDKAFNEQRAVV